MQTDACSFSSSDAINRRLIFFLMVQDVALLRLPTECLTPHSSQILKSTSEHLGLSAVTIFRNLVLVPSLCFVKSAMKVLLDQTTYARSSESAITQNI